MLHMPVDVRSISLAVLAVIGTVGMLQWAQAVFVPLLLGLIFSYALAPLVDRLEFLRLPRAIAAALVLLGLLGALAGTAVALSDQAAQFVESLPDAAQKIRQAARAKRHEPETTIEKVQKAATELEKAAKESSATPAAAARGVTRVQIERPQININDYLLTSTPRHAGCGRTGHRGRVHHIFPAGFGRQLPAQACQAGWPDVRAQEDHGAGARRDHAADPALPADAGC